MARTVADSLGLKEPYPGLRPFRPSESCLFFGRETQVQELLERLPGHRFLGVVGVSGCGKSSLVLAGLIPALERGGLSGSSARWRMARLRPGNGPIGRLGAALRRADIQVDGLEHVLASSSMGLVEVAEAGLAANENLLLLVDQFEEIGSVAAPAADGVTRGHRGAARHVIGSIRRAPPGLKSAQASW